MRTEAIRKILTRDFILAFFAQFTFTLANHILIPYEDEQAKIKADKQQSEQDNRDPEENDVPRNQRRRG